MSLILEREEGRERNVDVRETHQLVASCIYPTGDHTGNLDMCPDQGIELATFWYMVRCSDQLNHLVRAMKNIIFTLKHT